ncbi:MAG: hypothetical protein JWM33_405 [Caulobacteraceae bacterium]|nr:hypothetical protein [Caulobacteraceae bacterium]
MSAALILLPLGLAAAAAGAALAASAQPACHWSSLGAIALKTRLAMIRAVAPTRRRARLAAIVLVGLMGSGGLAAYAAQPSAPERLAAQAAGVVGSGKQLSLRVVEAGKERTIKLGQDYADGWKLDALTPTSATLVRNGERREVGLNPTGALASAAPAAAPSQVLVTQSDDELLETAIRIGLWDGKTPRPGLTLEQSRRYALLYAKGMEAVSSYADGINAKSIAAGLGGIRFSDDGTLLISGLGAEGAEFVALRNTEILAKPALAAALFERYGPVEVTVPRSAPGPAANQAANREAIQQRDAAYPGASWTILPPVAGETTNTYVMRAADPQPQSLISTEIRPLDQLAFFGSGGPPGAPGMMTASQWLARAPGPKP